MGDEKIVKERQEAMTRRLALNAFKAREQQRERQLEIYKQKELHKVRMLEAEERKLLQDAEAEERIEILEAQKAEQKARNILRAERAIHEKRLAATQKVEEWNEKCFEAERNRSMMEVNR